MKDQKVEKQIEAGRQSLRRNRNARSDNLQTAAWQTGGQRERGDWRFQSLFSLNLRDLFGAGPLEKCWWISAPRTAQ
jgi:hypothetical protein